MIDENLALEWGYGELTNQYSAWEMPLEMLGDRMEGRRLFNNAVIVGKLAFGMG